MRKRKKREEPIKSFVKKDLSYYEDNFVDFCEKCGEKLMVIKHKPKTHTHREVLSATCNNKDFKGKGFRCELCHVEIRFIEKFI